MNDKLPNVSIDETQTAALRGHSIDTQRRHRRAGIGPKPFKASKGWRYWLADIEAEQKSGELLPVNETTLPAPKPVTEPLIEAGFWEEQLSIPAPFGHVRWTREGQFMDFNCTCGHIHRTEYDYTLTCPQCKTFWEMPVILKARRFVSNPSLKKKNR